MSSFTRTPQSIPYELGVYVKTPASTKRPARMDLVGQSDSAMARQPPPAFGAMAKGQRAQEEQRIRGGYRASACNVISVNRSRPNFNLKPPAAR